MSDAPPELKVPTTGEQMEYDYYRFYMLVSLLVLSGTITLAASNAADRIPHWLIVLGALLSIAGASLGFASQTEIVRIVSGRQLRRRVTRFGFGPFIALFAIAMMIFLLVVLEFL